MNPRSKAPRCQRGFTLVEAMVVVTVAGILATAAYPSYMEQVGRSRRADAQSVLMQAAQVLEGFHTENMRYDQNVAGQAMALPARLTQAPLDGATKYYTVSVQSVAAQTYTLAAVPKGSQAKDRCGTLTMTHTGVKAAALADCWAR